MVFMKTLLFDFGKVIGFFDYRLATRRLTSHSDLPAEELHALLFGSALEEDYEAGRISTEQFIRHARSSGRFRCSDDEFAVMYADIFWPNDEVCSLLPHLKTRFRLLLASNTNELHARQFRKQFANTLQHFHALVLSYQIGARKPSQAFFNHCLTLAGCEPKACLFIDDLPANVEGARSCGMNGLLYARFQELRQRLKTLLVGLT